MPLFVVLVVDGKGASEIVALWFVDKEDRETIREMLNFFKKHNPKFDDIRVVMADEDMTALCNKGGNSWCTNSDMSISHTAQFSKGGYL